MVSISPYGRHYADNIFVYIFLNGNFTQISQDFSACKSVHKGRFR